MRKQSIEPIYYRNRIRLQGYLKYPCNFFGVRMKIKRRSIIRLLLISAISIVFFAAGREASAGEFGDACFYMKSKWENERLSALQTFAELDDERAVPYVLKGIDDPAPAVRTRAASVLIKLGHINDRVSVPALLAQIAEEPDAKALEELIYALGTFSDSENTDMSLKSDFKNYKREHRYAVIDAMIPLISRHRLAYTRFFEVVRAAAMAPDDDLLRLHAVINMGEFGDPEYVLKPLLRTLGDKNDEVRAVTCKYLGGSKPFGALNPLILRGLNDVSPLVRRAAVIAVRNYDHPDTYAFFQKVLATDVDGEVRGEAALSFIGLKDRRAIRPLKNLGLVDAANVVRLNSAYALTTFDNSDGEGVLLWFLWEQNLAIYRRRAVSGLANLRSRTVISHLQRALSDWDDEVRDTAFYALRNKWGYNITQ